MSSATVEAQIQEYLNRIKYYIDQGAFQSASLVATNLAAVLDRMHRERESHE